MTGSGFDGTQYTQRRSVFTFNLSDWHDTSTLVSFLQTTIVAIRDGGLFDAESRDIPQDGTKVIVNGTTILPIKPIDANTSLKIITDITDIIKPLVTEGAPVTIDIEFGPDELTINPLNSTLGVSKSVNTGWSMFKAFPFSADYDCIVAESKSDYITVT
jgi:hypothetical protein